MRNVCVVLGNTGTAEDLPALEIAAADEDPLISEHAQWALGKIQERLSGSAAALMTENVVLPGAPDFPHAIEFEE